MPKWNGIFKTLYKAWFATVVKMFLIVNKVHFLQGKIPPFKYQFRRFLFMTYATKIKSKIGVVKLRKQVSFVCVGSELESFSIHSSTILGNGMSGTGTCKNVHRVSHSLLMLRISNLSSGMDFVTSSNHCLYESCWTYPTFSWSPWKRWNKKRNYAWLETIVLL